MVYSVFGLSETYSVADATLHAVRLLLRTEFANQQKRTVIIIIGIVDGIEIDVIFFSSNVSLQALNKFYWRKCPKIRI